LNHFPFLHRKTLAKDAYDARHIELWQIFPVAPDKSEVLHTAYLRPGLSADETAKAPGVRTGLLGTVVFGRNEPAPQHLHRGYLAAVPLEADSARES
jgi:hypothetical protein